MYCCGISLDSVRYLYRIDADELRNFILLYHVAALALGGKVRRDNIKSTNKEKGITCMQNICTVEITTQCQVH